VSDLVVLVFGIAVALWVLPWDLDGGEWSPPLYPRWWIVLGSVERAIRMTSLALIPPALWRRARLGGVCRPAELLLAVCAAPGVVVEVDQWVWSEADWNLDDGYGAAYWLCRAAVWSLCVAAMFGLTFARRRLSDGARSALLMLAVATSFAWLPDPEFLNTLPAYYSRAGFAEDTACVIAGAIKYLVPSVIGAAAIRDRILRRTRARTMEWVGLILAVCNLAVAPPFHLWGAFLVSSPPLRDLHLYIIYFGGPVLAATLGSILVWMWPLRCERARSDLVASVPSAPDRIGARGGVAKRGLR
jgi:hypothetical protein